jgi:fumarate reductase subunit D
MAVRQFSEPYLWLLFSAGGILSAMLLPIVALLLGIAIPLGWVPAPSYDTIRALVSNPITRLVLFGLAFLSFFHFAHRLRHTLHDAVRLKGPVITILCYGAAVAGSVWAVYLLLGL